MDPAASLYCKKQQKSHERLVIKTLDDYHYEGLHKWVQSSMRATMVFFYISTNFDRDDLETCKQMKQRCSDLAKSHGRARTVRVLPKGEKEFCFSKSFLCQIFDKKPTGWFTSVCKPIRYTETCIS
jgi:hypothetical protein